MAKKNTFVTLENTLKVFFFLFLIGDSLLSFKLNESDPTSLSLEATSVTPENDLVYFNLLL